MRRQYPITLHFPKFLRVWIERAAMAAIAASAISRMLSGGKTRPGSSTRIITEKLVEASRLLAREPQAMQLRYFAALHDTGSERSSTIVFPLPTDLLTHLAPRPDGAR
jgi:hypothetical protein